MMHRGYIKLWRKCTDSKMYQNPKLWTLWTYLLLEATHKPIKRYIGNQVVEQMPGQYITGRKRLAKELRVSERSIRTLLLALVKDQKVTIKTTNKYSIISIVNWDTYQPEKDKTTSKTTSDRPATDQQPTTEQEHKNVKNTNKSRKAGTFSFIDPSLLKRISVRWPKVYQWVGKCLKHKKNKNAIVHVLDRIDKTPSVTDFFGFVTQIMGVEDGNYNALEFDTKEAQSQQERLKEHLDSIGEKI